MLTAMHFMEAMLPLLYAATLAAYVRHFVVDDEADEGFVGSTMLAITLALHAGYFGIRGVSFSAFPLASKAEFVSLLALSIAAVYAVIERGAKDAHTGAFFLGIATPFQILGSIWMEDPDKQQMLLEHPTLQNPIYGVHVAALVLAFASLTVGVIYALMYLMLSRQLKSRDLGLVFKRLPALRTLQSMGNRSTVAGIALFGIGLILGHVVASVLGLQVNPFDPKIVMMDLAWLVYVVGALIVGWRGASGRRIGHLSVGGYVVLMVVIAASNLLMNSFHAFE